MAKQTEMALPEKIQEPTPQSLLELAIRQNVSVESLERLVKLHEQVEATKARRAFFEAFAHFQAQCPIVLKNKKGNNGKYAELSMIISTIKDLLSECGLTFRWEDVEGSTQISTTCIITHVDGHSIKHSMTGEADKSGNKSDIHAKASTISYLRRYTLTGALGIGTADEDTDASDKKPSAKDLSKCPQDALDKINLCNSVDELSMLWDFEAELQKNKEFITAMHSRKKFIQSQKEKA